MTKREVKIAVMGYISADKDPFTDKPLFLYGYKGEEVDVSDAYLAKFDSLNGQEPVLSPVLDDSEADHPEPTLDPTVPAGPEPLDHGAGDEPLPEPSSKARLAEWQAYAEQEGVDLEHEDGTAKTKRELVDELSSEG